MTNEKFYYKKRLCVGINKILAYILSFIWLPLLLNVIGLDSSIKIELGIGFVATGVYWILDRKYKTSSIFKKNFEDTRFTINFFILTILLLGLLIYQDDNKKGIN